MRYDVCGVALSHKVALIPVIGTRYLKIFVGWSELLLWRLLLFHPMMTSQLGSNAEQSVCGMCIQAISLKMFESTRTQLTRLHSHLVGP
jgi:hypothetical protein